MKAAVGSAHHVDTLFNRNVLDVIHLVKVGASAKYRSTRLVVETEMH